MPYLAHIKSLSRAWPSLRYLADFMQVGTTPLRWKYLIKNKEERSERLKRTKVTIVDISVDGGATCTEFDDASELGNWLNAGSGQEVKSTSTRLFFAEDLSREIIEMFGSKFDIDPTYFREQIDDYSWYNIRDRWAVMPSLMATMKHRNWLKVRYVRFRYFSSKDTFEKAREEANTFNVLRRPDNDHNHWSYLDEPGSLVTSTRTRTSIWVGKCTKGGGSIGMLQAVSTTSLSILVAKNNAYLIHFIGIILVDPTVRDGFPLWYGYANWAIPPSLQNPSPPKELNRNSLYKELIHWTLAHPWFHSREKDVRADPLVLVKPLLYTVCSEWMLVCEYIKTRLGQIEWELQFPEKFRSKGDVIDSSLERLHTWRRVVPLYREMISETLTQALPAACRLTRTNPHDASTDKPATERGEPAGFEDVTQDFERVRVILEELQGRVDRLTSYVLAAISMEDSRRGLNENRNLARLTWLASIFIPMSFVTGFFSMQPDISSLKITYGWYFAAAVPLTVLTLALATSGHARRLFERSSLGGMKAKTS
jgi:hypothetical protein